MTRGRGVWLWRALACACVLALAAPIAARAQAACASPAAAPHPWPAPLDRIVSIPSSDLPLRDALHRISAAAGIRISYSAELLPLDRRVCIAPGARTVGDALSGVLRDTPVEPLVAGADHVVLGLRRSRPAAAARADTGEAAVALERVVVTGSAAEGARSPRAYAVDVVDARRLQREGTAPLSRLLTSATPGTWAWEASPSALTARYGSIRGASSFGASTPRVFIDGIEVANPLLATQIAPEAVERIEVIRGPQGAALYGTGGISGIVNIVTRHEGTADGAPRLRIRTGLGMANSDFASSTPVAQEHALSLRAGDAARSAGLDVAAGGVGEYVPRGSSRYLLATANARRVAARSVVTGTARYYAAGAGPAENPLLAAASLADSAARQAVRQYTFGGSVRWTPDARWTHTLIAGVDGDRVRGAVDAFAPVPYAPNSGPYASEGGADRLTLRWSSVARVYAGERTSVDATLAAEHSTLRERMAGLPGLGLYGIAAIPAPAAQPFVLWTRTTGVLAQATASMDERLHLTAGVRVERGGGLTDAPRDAVLPVLGGAWITGIGADATLKVRGAFGRGIRPVRTLDGTAGAQARLRGYGRAPEEQQGVEGGFDLALGRVLQVQVTAFDQLASGLAQRVAVDDARWTNAGGTLLQNVGQISNRGWEMQAVAASGRWSVEGAFARVDSRVRRVAAGYTGPLREGDRMLEVPARTLSLTGTWAGDGWSASLAGHRAFDWMAWDRLALAHDFGANQPSAGADLRAYRRSYTGATHLNAAATLDLAPSVALLLTGDNLLDHQRGEPDNATVVPGRTLSFGIRAAF